MQDAALLRGPHLAQLAVQAEVWKGIMNALRSDITRRTLLKAGAAVGGSFLLPAAARAEPKRGGRMVLGTQHGSTTDTTDPGGIVNTLQSYVAFAYASTLTEMLPDRKIGPNLALSWDSKDALTWQIKIRTDVLFHDGRPIVPEDVVASLNYHRLPDSTSSMKPSADQFDTITVDGKDGIIIKLKSANADLPSILTASAFSVFPALGESIDWQSHNGSGPYILESFEPGVRALLKRNPNYWRTDRGFVDEVEFQSIPDATAATSALMAGQIQAIDQVDLKTVEMLRSAPGIVVEETSGSLHYSFPMLIDAAPFNDTNVRKALKHAIDRQEIIDKVLSGYGTIGNDNPIGPSYPFHAGDLAQNLFDPDKAKFYLSKAGQSNLTVDLHAADAAFGGAVDAAVLFAEQAKQSGIAINVSREANDAYWDNIWMKKPFCAAYWAGYPSESQMFAMGYAPDAPWNDTRWNNTRFEELRQAGAAELDDTKRREIYHEMQEMLRDDGGALIFTFPTSVIARSDQLAHGPLGTDGIFDGERIAERWWIA
jgi:peptide/nickel transport system substrate-binding protein